MSETAFLFATLAALLAAKGFALIAVRKGRSDGLPRPTQIDRSRSSRHDGASQEHSIETLRDRVA
jgi:hypothetical protein